MNELPLKDRRFVCAEGDFEIVSSAEEKFRKTKTKKYKIINTKPRHPK